MNDVLHGPLNRADARVLAFHEAGHIVATRLRSGASFRSLDMGRTSSSHAVTNMSYRPWDGPFLTFAGIWSEARFNWSPRPLEGEDEDGLTFDDYLMASYLENADGDAQDMRAHDVLAECPAGMDREAWGDMVNKRQDGWNRELERAWPVVSAVAEHIFTHWTITPDDLDDLAAAHGY